MSKKKKKSQAAETLIASLIEDVKGLQSEASYHSAQDFGEFSLSSEFNDHRVEGSNIVAEKLWDSFEKAPVGGIEKELDAAEFNGDLNLNNQDYHSEHSLQLDIPADEKSIAPPEGLEDLQELASAEPSFRLPSAEEERYQGPSADAQYQSVDDLFIPDQPVAPTRYVDDEATRPVGFEGNFANNFENKFSAVPPESKTEDKTVSIQQQMESNIDPSVSSTGAEPDKTIAVEGFANAQARGKHKSKDFDVKVSVGSFRGGGRSGSNNVLTSVDASLAQAESLKIAQQRILELEKEVESLRAENEELSSAGEIVRTRTDEMNVRISLIEKEKEEIQESARSEILILKGNLQYKESEVAKARLKIDELETRLKSDFKKIRVRERELENRLELLRAEKAALIRSKDEYILDQKRKIDQLSQELDNYRKKCLELNKALEANQDQFKRTERALRLALTNLEVTEENLPAIKKAD